ncbi:hypothetical protein [Dyadobacter bucti]|uniref:hypothetical protein n=1 Tax=Dyadobacter bucti TaxID=2572203 RepID=UPI003F6E6F60
MTELPDDELDKLFKKSMKELNPKFKKEDWDALSKRLELADEKAKRERIIRWPLLKILVLSIITGLGLYYLFNDIDIRGKILGRTAHASKVHSADPIRISPQSKNYQQNLDDTINGFDNLASQNQKTGSGTMEKSRIRAADTLDAMTVKTFSDNLGENSRIKKSNAFQKGKLSRSQPTRPYQHDKSYPQSGNRKNTDRVQISSTEFSNEDGLEFDAKVPAYPGLRQKSHARQNVEPPVIFNTDQIQPENTKSRIVAQTPDISKQDTSKQDDRKRIFTKVLDHRPYKSSLDLVYPAVIGQKNNEDQLASTPKAENHLSPKLAFQFGYSPDISTVKIKNFSKPGSAIFMMAEYSVSNRLYFQLGLVRSKKIYNALAGEYKWPSNWKQNTLPISVDGTCKIYEVPFNLRYDITQKGSYRWFATTGVSSYYMASEKYVYNYPPYSTNIKWYDYQVKTGWYLLSHANVSVGYEYRFLKKLSLIAEPYMRIPMKKVGYGKINLMTTGVWLSLRYTPVFK